MTQTRTTPFEKAFGVPADHTLKQIRYKSKGFLAMFESWTHEEYDAAGNLVARYESWHNTDPKRGKTESGYVKYDSGGQRIGGANELAI